MSGIFSLLLRILLTVFTLVFVVGLVLVALVTMFVLLVWSLVRGRRPTIDMGRFRRATQYRPGGSTRQPVGDVVDVEAREVPGSGAPRLE
ncbi:hypothetical protein [Pelomonas sp. SE-A7]|uniref:hypothetical protein n=1 Tax=Pelomonas sp. SE-A7 TaxID=3054953 RepID=UPI00259D117F|nr:hypothetical protein [Pelomonas sp. SE-A7]MDM4765595.1 hypothetical protein [Pelomonas sp. SE-A7]